MNDCVLFFFFFFFLFISKIHGTNFYKQHFSVYNPTSFSIPDTSLLADLWHFHITPFTQRWSETTETKILVSVQSEEENDENENDSYVYSEKREDNDKQRLQFLWHILRQGSERTTKTTFLMSLLAVGKTTFSD